MMSEVKNNREARFLLAENYPSAITARNSKVYFSVYSKKGMLEPSLKPESLENYQTELNKYAKSIIDIIDTLGISEPIS